ncbi:hypothetical protein [Amycolatopsis samaneae]|uniref:Uncharacterized protein n=1 Tax=Amycolatopsis samaneae TaxID=664691 RepID=A0ABW5GIA2_9PSEU
MEQHPHEPHDRDNHGPEREKLNPSEIDLTGSIDQPDALRDVIWDAIAEVRYSQGELPEWGARTIARALANRLNGPGALHHYAVTGRADRDAMVSELVVIYATTDDSEIREWANHLGKYLVKATDTPDQSGTPGAKEQLEALEVHPDSTPLEKISAYLRISFAAADAEGGAIPQHVAEVIAVILVPLLPPDSEFERLLRTGQAYRGRLHEECESLRKQAWRAPDMDLWITRFEQYLTETERATGPTEPPGEEPVESADNPQVAQGIREHGDAFRAFLRLSDVDPSSDTLIQNFLDLRMGSFDSMDELLNELTEFPNFRAAVTEAEQRWGFEDFVSYDQEKLEATVRATWDVVELNGKFHVFMR